MIRHIAFDFDGTLVDSMPTYVSTMLRILGGLLSPSSGRVIVDGQELHQSERALTEYRREIGFVFQRGGLFHHMTGRENIIAAIGCAFMVPFGEAPTELRSLSRMLSVRIRIPRRPAVGPRYTGPVRESPAGRSAV